jgi:hypothetical protein
MHFFERYLSLSPDGGSGLLELSYAAVIVLVTSIFVCRSKIVQYLRPLIAFAGRLRSYHG